VAQEAEYEVMIPKTDAMGNPVADMGTAAMSHLTSEVKVTKAHIEPNRQVFWQGRMELFDALVFVAEDSPHSDSTAKQLGNYLGEVANQDVVLVSKRGKSGIQTWPVRNNSFQPDMPGQFPAQRAAIEPPLA
jgi:folylpolyglutamate synthase/dihydropteroate synthase